VSFALVAKSISKKFGVECVPNHIENRLQIIKNMWTIISTSIRRMALDGIKICMITCDKVYDEELVV